MEPKQFEELTPQQAAKDFRSAKSTGTEAKATAYADCYFSEREQIQEFLACWRKLSEFSVKVRQAELKGDVDRIWKD
jgi:hypothetical protein